jgi:hypothetical protein
MQNGLALCHTIELPWKDNQPKISCVPEGTYQLAKRYSAKFGWHLQLMDVPRRSLILIHPANDARRELLGCIAPVSALTGIGKGNASRIMFKKLLALTYPVLATSTAIYLHISSTQIQNCGAQNQ